MTYCYPGLHLCSVKSPAMSVTVNTNRIKLKAGQASEPRTIRASNLTVTGTSCATKQIIHWVCMRKHILLYVRMIDGDDDNNHDICALFFSDLGNVQYCGARLKGMIRPSTSSACRSRSYPLWCHHCHALAFCLLILLTDLHCQMVQTMFAYVCRLERRLEHFVGGAIAKHAEILQ